MGAVTPGPGALFNRAPSEDDRLLELKQAYVEELISIDELESEVSFVLNGGYYAGSFLRVMRARRDVRWNRVLHSDDEPLGFASFEGGAAPGEAEPVRDPDGTIVGYIKVGGDDDASSAS